MKKVFNQISVASLEEDLDLHGMLHSNITIMENISFNVFGIVNGDVTLKKDSKVIIRGIVNGNIINHEGNVEIYGVVNGKVEGKLQNTFVHKKAIIRDGINYSNI